MESEFQQRKNRIKLRVVTSTGLNLLCTANRSQNVKELLPHIIKLYEEVKQDQGLNSDQNTRAFIKFIRKEQYLIAPSELVGDIFDDNDEVFCDMGLQPLTGTAKKSSKIQKKEEKEAVVKSESQPPKTKKIKKSTKPQIQQQKEQGGQDPIKNQTVDKMSEQQGKVSSSQKVSETQKQQKPVQQQKSSEHKKKKNKNKNKTAQSQPSEKTPILNLDPKLNPSIKPQQPKQPQQKKKQAETKPNQPMVSSDELLKFKQLMKKASSSAPVADQ